jgi:hypothetical protein
MTNYNFDLIFDNKSIQLIILTKESLPNTVRKRGEKKEEV